MIVTYEKMAEFFHKLHLGDGSVLHVFTDTDHGDPHDHPFAFDSEVLVGGYVETHWYPTSSGWFARDVRREAGERFTIPHNHVHRINRLLEPVTITRIWPRPFERPSGFWQFRADGAYRRQHDSDEWIKQ